MMNAVEVHDHARKLYVAQGGKALADATEKARRYALSGDKGLAEDWRRIQAALKELIGPSVS
ncbi:hypothetical protein [Hyphomicrobium sp.]|uniref:hypothetical protein n=1 Tax=Hyphomicrobium sp. TaxID=82 RepID=UPI0025C34059|nr:hypothetical protein [Hyphomicrobium sp.]